MRLTLVLADSAQSVDGKLYVLGGGWSLTGPGPFTSALAVILEVPWDRSNTPLDFHLDLRDGDGRLVTQPGPLGEQPVRLTARLEVGRPPGLVKGSPLNVALAVNIGPLQLVPGRRYSWEASVTDEDGKTERDEDWYVGFQTRPLP